MVGLTLWVFLQFAFLAEGSFEFGLPLYTMSVLLRGLPHFWMLSLLPALGFGVAWYAYSWLPPRPSGFWIARDRRLVHARTLTTLTVGLFLGQFLYRIWGFAPLIGSDLGLASPAVLSLAKYPDVGSAVWLMVRLLEGVALLGAAFLLLQARQLVRELGGNPRAMTRVFVVALGLGLLVPVTGWYPFLPPPSAGALKAVRRWPGDAQAFVRGGGDDEEVRRLDRLFFATRRRGRTWVTQGNVNLLRDQPNPDLDAICATVLLPYSRLLTATGLSFDLSDDGPEAAGPSLVVEVPARGHPLRIYEADEEPRVIEWEELTTLRLATDWVILKADTAVKGTSVIRLLRGLRDRGIRRVSLAVLSTGPFPPPDRPVRLRFDAMEQWPTYEPRARRGAVYVPRWTPPPGPGWVPPPCEWDDSEYVRWMEKGFAIPDPGELGGEVAIRSNGSYQELIRRLGGAAAARVRTVQVGFADREGDVTE